MPSSPFPPFRARSLPPPPPPLWSPALLRFLPLPLLLLFRRLQLRLLPLRAASTPLRTRLLIAVLQIRSPRLADSVAVPARASVLSRLLSLLHLRSRPTPPPPPPPPPPLPLRF